MKSTIVALITVLALLMGFASANATVLTGEEMAAQILGSSKSSSTTSVSAKKATATAPSSSSDFTAMRKKLLVDLEKKNADLIRQERAATNAALDQKLQVFSGIKGSMETHDKKMTREFNRTNNTVWENSKWVGEKVDYRFSLLATLIMVGFVAVIIMIVAYARKAKTIIGFRTPTP